MTRPAHRPALLLALVCARGCAGDQSGATGVQQSGVCAGPHYGPPCADDAECAAVANAQLVPFHTAAQGGPRRLIAAQCTATEACDPPAPPCECQVARDGGEVEEVALGRSGCALYGRSLACLWPETEALSCTPGTCDCADACVRAVALLDADDARVVPVQTRAARCATGTCSYVVRVDDRCYAGEPAVAHEVECARSDEDLLEVARENALAVPACNDLILCAVDPSAGVSAEDPVASCAQRRERGVTRP